MSTYGSISTKRTIAERWGGGGVGEARVATLGRWVSVVMGMFSIVKMLKQVPGENSLNQLFIICK